jgi:hypothetical protein
MILGSVSAAAMSLAALPAMSQTELEDTMGYSSAKAFGPVEGDWEFQLGGSGSNDNDFDSGIFSLNLSGGYYFTDNILGGVRQNISFADSGSDSSWNGSSVAFADYVWDFGKVRPFVGITLGGLYGDGVDDTFIAGPEAGVKYYVKEETFLFGRVNYDFLFDSADDADSSIDDGRFVYAVGVGFNF